MRALFFSDIHLRIGPREPIRPELRRSMRWLNGLGNTLVERFEDHLRMEADRVISVADSWIRERENRYDLVINGGDVAMPLSRHEDRMAATEEIWKSHLDQFGQDRLIVITGNHELGHGYQSEPTSYPDLMDLRKHMFDRDINRFGYGFERYKGVSLLALDSEILSMYAIDPGNKYIRKHLIRMTDEVLTISRIDGPVTILTHNTYPVRKWLENNGLLSELTRNRRQVTMVGGHYHIPRYRRKKGLDIFWAGGASYPEPWLRFVTHMPFSGFRCCGPGSVELKIDSNRISTKLKPFGVNIYGKSRQHRMAA